MSHITGTKVRIGAAIAAIGLAAGIVACSHEGDVYYDNCPDWQCGDGLYFAPYIIPPVGVYGQPGYHPQIIIQPGQPNYHTTYIGKPPNFVPPPSAKVNPSTAKPPANYRPPTGATLTVQKAPSASGNTMPSSKPSSGGGSSRASSQPTVQKAPTQRATSKPSSGGGSSRRSK